MSAALASAVLLSACGGSSHTAGAGASAGTSIASAVVAFVAPRDGADEVIGSQLASFAQTAQSKLLDDCMANDGLPAPSFGIGGPPTDLGNSQFPNLPEIEATHDLGLFTGGVALGGNDPQRGMSQPERRAWQARLQHCFRATQRHALLFGSSKFGQLDSSWFNIVNQIMRSKRIRMLSKPAATCSAARGVPATSVMSLYGRLQGELGFSSSSQNSQKAQRLQAKGASVLAKCWTTVLNAETSLLSQRRAAYLAQNATAVAALQSQVNEQVAAFERHYGIKLTLVSS